MKKIKTGIMGGSFDPIHKAHTALALEAFKQAKLDEIFFLPAHRAPLKDSPLASDVDRLAMLNLALEDFPAPNSVIDLEMSSNKPINYSVDTAQALIAKYPDRDFFWIIGSDHVAKLKLWHDIKNLANKVGFIIAERQGFPLDESLIPEFIRWQKISFSPMQNSSTALRSAISSGKSECDFMLDARVKNYIVSHKLYFLLRPKKIDR